MPSSPATVSWSWCKACSSWARDKEKLVTHRCSSSQSISIHVRSPGVMRPGPVTAAHSRATGQAPWAWGPKPLKLGRKHAGLISEGGAVSVQSCSLCGRWKDGWKRGRVPPQLEDAETDAMATRAWHCRMATSVGPPSAPSPSPLRKAHAPSNVSPPGPSGAT